MTTLYRKEGRRYVVIGHAEHYDYADSMKPGTWRMTYCYANGAGRYRYDVKPDTASFMAACELAGEAMERRIRELAAAHPSPERGRPYTAKQRAIIERYRAEMAEAGGMFPTWWEYTSARELADAAIDAVRNWRQT